MHIPKGFRSGAALLVALAGAGAVQPASAEEGYGPRVVRLYVVDTEADKAKKVYLHKRRYFVAGETGKRYALRIQNVSKERVMAVLSVDGINVITGNSASHNDSGYILKPGQVADINGWRKSQEEIAIFRFAPLPQSYAARTGRPADVGVIGMAVFIDQKPPKPVKVKPVKPTKVEKPKRDKGSSMPADVPFESSPPPPPPPPMVESAPPPPPMPAPPPMIEPVPLPRIDSHVESPNLPNTAPVAQAPIPRPVQSAKLGTAHGEIVKEFMPYEPFTKTTAAPVSVRTLEYDSWENLMAAGVIPASEAHRRVPNPFPGKSGDNAFVPDPPGQQD